MSPTSYLAAPPRVAPRLYLRAEGRQSTKLGINPGHAATAATRGGLGVSVVRPTPLHMRGHQHAIGIISFVISAHVVGMYAFSIISGRLADRWGRLQVIITGGTWRRPQRSARPEGHPPELQPLAYLDCRLFLEKK